MKEKKSILAIGVVVGIGIGLALVVFATLVGVQVIAQQQTTPADAHHVEKNSNQSGSGMAEERQQQNTTTKLSGQVMMNNQTFTTSWISLVGGVKVTGVSGIDTEHIAVNLRYDGEGTPLGVSVVAVVAIKNSSSGAIIDSNMMQQHSMSGQEGEMMREMIVRGNQQSNSSIEQESQQHDQQQMQNSISTSNSSMPILSIQSGSNYLEAGWQGQESNSATVLVQLDGDIPEGGHIMVMVFPFLHR
jgi:peroxiredoxin family protein